MAEIELYSSGRVEDKAQRTIRLKILVLQMIYVGHNGSVAYGYLNK
jgi:hypothetical protein